MRLSLDPRAQRLLRRLPRTTVYSAMEIILLSVLAVQCARLVWAIFTPVGPIGDWRGDGGTPVLPTPDSAYFESFDPFFRLEGGGTLIVTDLDIQLFGVREDRATGRGSAIIALPSGEQISYVVGDAIMPGVILESVGFDFVTITRNGAREQIFLDQSGGASPVTGNSGAASGGNSPTAQPATVSTPATGNNTVTARELAGGTQISPRREGDRLTGIIIQPTSGDALARAGFLPGDIIISINGTAIQNMEQAAGFANMLSGNAEVQVERGGEVTSFRARVGQ